MKLVNRYLENLVSQGLAILWEKYQQLPGQKTSIGEFQQQLDTLIQTSIASTLDPQIREFGILVSDLRGFTPITEKYPPLLIVQLLNKYYSVMIRIIDGHGGVVDKLMGDSIMALFDSKGNDRAAQHLLNCVIDMQLAMDEVNVFAEELGMPLIYMGIGMNYGSMVVCELGSEIYREITVMGDQVNLASRLSAYCLRGQVLMSENLFRLLQDDVVLGKVYDVQVKGKTLPITTYEVLGLDGETQKLLPVRDSRKSLRVDVDLPVTYFSVETMQVSDIPVHAKIMDMSRQGMKILTNRRHEYLDEIKIIFAFITSDRVSEIYAKVLSCYQDEKSGLYSLSVEFTYMDEATSSTIKVFVDHLI
ncbi:MAG: adenylate/guanylate cyclase domain-containing protein [Pseudomonadota bacterium]